MPTYEYQCKACGHQLEVFQKMSDEPLKECPKCHEASLAKLVSAANFQLKGTGWYVTDFRDKGKPKEKTTDETKESTTKADTETKKEKPEKEPASKSTDTSTKSGES